MRVPILRSVAGLLAGLIFVALFVACGGGEVEAVVTPAAVATVPAVVEGAVVEEAAAEAVVEMAVEAGETAVRCEELAEWANTIPYEVLTNINTRVPRVYVGSAE